MVTDRKPQPVPEWSEVIKALKDEVASLQRGIMQLEAELAEARREQHVRMGQS